MAYSDESKKTDSLPILSSGIQQIGDWQIDQYFYNPFTGGVIDSSRRLYLVRKLTAYLSELKRFDLQIEIWIDGSFVTKKPDPDDIDIIVWVYSHELDNMPVNRQPFFARLTTEREFIRAKYDIDVYLAYLDNPDEIAYWTGKFSKGHYSYTSKGFFKIVLTHV